MSVFQFDPEGRIREVFQNLPLHFNQIFLGHRYLAPGKPAPLKFAFFNKPSY